MIFVVSRSSDHRDRQNVEIETFEELKKFQEDVAEGHPLIIDFLEYSIEIYDDWRE